MKHYSLIILGFVAVFPLLIAGCSYKGISGLVAVEGKITLDGTPVDEAGIVFTPESGTDVRFATAVSRADGTFRLQTLEQHGALPGTYIVTVSKQKHTPVVSNEEAERLANEDKPIPPAKIEYLIPQAYERPAAGLRVEVGPKGNKTVVLELTSNIAAPPPMPRVD